MLFAHNAGYNCKKQQTTSNFGRKSSVLTGKHYVQLLIRFVGLICFRA